jgi:hypothetical protein
MMAFCVGRHLQQITAGALIATSKNSEALLVFNIFVKAGPSIRST